MNFDNVHDYVIVKNIMPQNFCKKCIKQFTELEWSKHHWTKKNEPFNKYTEEKDEIDVLTLEGNLHDTIRPYICDAIINYQNKFQTSDLEKQNKQFVPILKYSTPRVNRYSKGQKMAKHQDHISSLFKNWEGIPILSLVGVFNDDYKGGNFILRDKKIDLKTGDILIFPSLFIYTHEVTEITEGVRHSFVSWAY